MRHAHRLNQKDTRGYSQLPEHLRPPKEIDLNDVPPEALTTCARLLFRGLLDRFEGDAPPAVAAYNGGLGNPNVACEAVVRATERAAALHGRPAAGMQFLTPAR